MTILVLFVTFTGDDFRWVEIIIWRKLFRANPIFGNTINWSNYSE